MENHLSEIQTHMKELVDDWINTNHLKANDLFVLGCSTSEIAGKRIGSSGSEEIAAIIYEELQRLKEATGVELAFQCCEHLNRALVVEQHVMEKKGYEQVSAIPVRTAGGSMASYAYKQMQNAVLVEHIKADAGLDIGDTFIGMHLKHVAVPIRLARKSVGDAHVTAAKTRPKLIGGERAVYTLEQEKGGKCE